MMPCGHGEDWRGPDGCEARGCPDIYAERQAVLIGPSAVAALRAERARHARLRAARLERDRRLVAAIGKVKPSE